MTGLPNTNAAQIGAQALRQSANTLTAQIAQQTRQLKADMQRTRRMRFDAELGFSLSQAMVDAQNDPGVLQDPSSMPEYITRRMEKSNGELLKRYEGEDPGENEFLRALAESRTKGAQGEALGVASKMTKDNIERDFTLTLAMWENEVTVDPNKLNSFLDSKRLNSLLEGLLPYISEQDVDLRRRAIVEGLNMSAIRGAIRAPGVEPALLAEQMLEKAVKAGHLTDDTFIDSARTKIQRRKTMASNGVLARAGQAAYEVASGEIKTRMDGGPSSFYEGIPFINEGYDGMVEEMIQALPAEAVAGDWIVDPANPDLKIMKVSHLIQGELAAVADRFLRQDGGETGIEMAHSVHEAAKKLGPMGKEAAKHFTSVVEHARRLQSGIDEAEARVARLIEAANSKDPARYANLGIGGTRADTDMFIKLNREAGANIIQSLRVVAMSGLPISTQVQDTITDLIESSPNDAWDLLETFRNNGDMRWKSLVEGTGNQVDAMLFSGGIDDLGEWVEARKHEEDITSIMSNIESDMVAVLQGKTPEHFSKKAIDTIRGMDGDFKGNIQFTRHRKEVQNRILFEIANRFGSSHNWTQDTLKKELAGTALRTVANDVYGEMKDQFRSGGTDLFSNSGEVDLSMVPQDFRDDLMESITSVRISDDLAWENHKIDGLSGYRVGEAVAFQVMWEKMGTQSQVVFLYDLSQPEGQRGQYYLTDPEGGLWARRNEDFGAPGDMILDKGGLINASAISEEEKLAMGNSHAAARGALARSSEMAPTSKYSHLEFDPEWFEEDDKGILKNIDSANEAFKRAMSIAYQHIDPTGAGHRTLEHEDSQIAIRQQNNAAQLAAGRLIQEGWPAYRARFLAQTFMRKLAEPEGPVEP